MNFKYFKIKFFPAEVGTGRPDELNAHLLTKNE